MNYKNSCDGDGTRKFTICFSGKRKSGKDYVALKLTKLLQEEGCTVSICHLSDPLKERFAAMKTEMGEYIDPERLKDNDSYKEYVRSEMVRYGEEIRSKDPEIFCREALVQRKLLCQGGNNCYSYTEIIVVADCRRKSDLQFFEVAFGHDAIFVRIDAALMTRNRRGFEFVDGIDDAETECGLDNYANWHFRITNDFEGDISELSEIVEFVKNLIVS